MYTEYSPPGEVCVCAVSLITPSLSFRRDARAGGGGGWRAGDGPAPGVIWKNPISGLTWHAPHTRRAAATRACARRGKTLNSNTNSSGGIRRGATQRGSHKECAHPQPRQAATRRRYIEEIPRTKDQGPRTEDQGRRRPQMLGIATWTSVISNCSRSPGGTRNSVPPSLVGISTPG